MTAQALTSVMLRDTPRATRWEDIRMPAVWPVSCIHLMQISHRVRLLTLPSIMKGRRTPHVASEYPEKTARSSLGRSVSRLGDHALVMKRPNQRLFSFPGLSLTSLY